MTHRRFAGTVALLSAALVVAFGCDKPPAAASAPPPPPVVVVQPIRQTVIDYKDFTGRTEPVESVDVRARVAGYLEKIPFTDGQEVKKGDVLFQIDARPFQAEFARANAEIGRVEAQLTKARNELARLEEPRKTGAVSQLEYDNSVANVKGFESQLEASKATADAAKLNVEYSTIKSPINGRASRPRVTVGNLVSSETLLTTIVSLDPIYVYFDADERAVLDFQKNVKKDQLQHQTVREAKVPISVAKANDPDFPHKGIIDFVENRLDESTGTLKIRAVLENAGRRLTPGFFVRVRWEMGAPRDALVIPERALGNDQGNRFVFVVAEDGTVEYRPIKVGGITGTMRVVTEGLKETDWVIVDGLQRARAGAKVTPKKETLPATTQGS